MQTSNILATQRDSKGDSIWVARREKQRRRRRAWTCTKLLEVPRNSQEVGKTRNSKESRELKVEQSYGRGRIRTTSKNSNLLKKHDTARREIQRAQV